MLFRSESAVIDIIEDLKLFAKRILIYEPQINDEKFLDCEVVKDFKLFTKDSDIIVANRLSESIKQHSEKLFSRDLFNYF